MGAPHGHLVHFHGHSPLHRAPAHLKVVGLVVLMLVVVGIPRGVWWPYLGHAALLAVVWIVSRVPVRHVLPRMVVEVPVLVFAAALPFAALGERVEVAGLSLSRDGLEGAGMILAKGTIGVLAAVLLASTTEARDLVAGLQRLRVPGPLVQILALMLRYVEVVLGEWRRMRVARAARGFESRGPAGWGVLGRAVAALFVRSYERGERVHLAMLARGYDGRMPDA